LELVRAAARDDSRLRLIHHPERLGIPRSRNEAIRLATSPLLGMVDSDDTLLPDALATAIAFMDERPEVALAYSDIDILENGVLRRDVRGIDWPGRQAFLKWPWSSHFNIFRRSAYDEAGGFEESISRCHTIDFY